MSGPALPDFPWDSLTGARERAQAHPGGLVDLSVGTPVDPVPELLRAALSGPAAGEPGYPTAHGPASLREAVVASMARRFGVPGIDPAAVLPTIGSKELVAWLPTLLGLGAGDTVVIPELAYPTYEVGARLAGADHVRSDGLTAAGPARVRLVWLNSPSNPTGRVLPPEHLRKVVAWARERGAVVASDECYLGLPGEADPAPRSVLHPEISDGDHTGLIAVHSLSKISNLAGYRAGFVTGDPELVSGLLAVRKHAGMIVSRPVQAAVEAAVSDDAHVAEQAARYDGRRSRLRAGLLEAGLEIEHSRSGLYLWATGDEPCRETVDRLAGLGILVTPGEFYGPAGARHVRVALTASDERIDAAVERLGAS
ncbi:succinyldiaminopimelate transaminase [Pseudonocardia sp. HH130630-07]|uniref:succinyldiaminopimelate transaminase n=1 Tax=Pseudonocardia sp. HH130630-07 TaxID=1690815 RepID=UPI000814FD42|nr:succinyldiaminopimelate transaminase [Pseudonocardia sp. HH130630-07]ANY05979.1 succinyldiaminopimelate transaminase [Pseudonocardia sp. HH130630-07]